MFKQNLYDEYEYEIYDDMSFKPGDHICSLYDNEEDYFHTLVHYIREGLVNNEKVIYVTRSDKKNIILDMLSRELKGLPDGLMRNHLSIIVTEDILGPGGIFCPDKMITRLKERYDLFLKAGYPVVRLGADVSWVLGNLGSFDDLVAYEARVNWEFFRHHKCIGLCHYDQRLFPSKILSAQMDNHPICHVGKEMYLNQFHIPADSEVSEFEHKIHQMKLRKEREKTVASLYKQTEELKEFSYLLSHDLKGPINTAHILCTMLQEDYAPDILERAISSLKKAADRLESIEDIHEITLPILPPLPMDLNQWLVELINEYQPDIERIGGEIQFQAQEALPIQAVKKHFIQLFSNLLDNSIKYRKNEAGLAIIVKAMRKGEDEIKVIVEDNGIGFPSHANQKVFSPFFRYPTALNVAGSGIGLTICQRIMHKYSGTITAESEEGKGARFEITFPLYKNPCP